MFLFLKRLVFIFLSDFPIKTLFQDKILPLFLRKGMTPELPNNVDMCWLCIGTTFEIYQILEQYLKHTLGSLFLELFRLEGFRF